MSADDAVRVTTRLAMVGTAVVVAIGARSMLRSARASYEAYSRPVGLVEGPPSKAQGTHAAHAARSLGVTNPRQIRPSGWLVIVKRTWKTQTEHNTGLLAAGVTYYGFLSLFPALVAVIFVYGLVATPADVQAQVAELGSALPSEAQTLIQQALTSIASDAPGALSLGLALSVGLALWSASAAVNGLMGALNVIYYEQEDRNLVRKRGTALLLTLGAIVFVAAAAFLLAALPALVEALGLGEAGQFVLLGARWVGLLFAFIGGLGVLYRVGPDRADPRVRWIGPGAVIATVLWILVSIGFTVYADNFSRYDRMYGALAGVVVLLLWLYFTSYAVLLGAEVNAQTELSTGEDTTTGPPRPPGERDAFVADHVAT